MSSARGESKEYRTSDTLLVRIAERPLVVAALFLFTALFPWVIYFLAPFLAKVTLLDLIQWLTLPILFILVNGLVFVLWMNHIKSSTSSSAARHHEDAIHALDEAFKKPAFIEIPKPAFIEIPKPASIEIPQPKEFEEPVISSGSSSGSVSEEQQGPKFEAPVMPEPEPEARPIKGHHKSKSLGENVKLDLSLVEELQKAQQAKSGGVSRRHSTPKSRLGGTNGSGSGKQRVGRRNTSPKSTSATPHLRLDKEQRSATLHEGSSYTPPAPLRQPVPLDKDDLNARIDNFLTKFKIERQESNLRAALKTAE